MLLPDWRRSFVQGISQPIPCDDASERPVKVTGAVVYFSCGGQEAEDIPGVGGRERERKAGDSRSHVPIKLELEQ